MSSLDLGTTVEKANQIKNFESKILLWPVTLLYKYDVIEFIISCFQGWKICKCGTGFTLTGIIFIVIGVLLLIYYAKYFDEDDWKK